jgi:two-component system sensor histidine kinase PilS (NtrC family)
MHKPAPQTLSPCPFSKGYKIPVRQAWFLLKGFYFYRLILSSILLSLYYSRLGALVIEAKLMPFYFYTSLTYFLCTLIGWSLILKPITSYASQAQAFVFTDIVFLTLIMHAFGGISSGLGALILIPTAAGGILIGGRCAMLFAALASLFVFAEQAYSFRLSDINSNYAPYAGMLGAGFFMLALLSYILAKRTEQTEVISSQQQETITSLEELNQYIIQNMQSGIIITDQAQNLSRHNMACPHLLGLSHLPDNLTDISPKLTEAFEQWLKYPNKDFVSLISANKTQIHVHFSALPTQHETFFMITLEDVSVYKQRVQQSKLASLGKLTASIAHEIRNPLGAISHAGQLLAECPTLSTQDLRLTEIIQVQARRMNAIIEDVLQLSRSPQPTQETIDLVNWLSNYLETLIRSNDGYQNQFELSIDSKLNTALFDIGHLTQILNNLCANALKYGYTLDKKICIQLNEDLGLPCINVIDFGNGIPDKIMHHLFEPFVTSSHSGTGLGLYISKDLAEINQARLSYHTLENQQGCFFRLCLPTAKQKKIKL